MGVNSAGLAFDLQYGHELLPRSNHLVMHSLWKEWLQSRRESQLPFRQMQHYKFSFAKFPSEFRFICPCSSEHISVSFSLFCRFRLRMQQMIVTSRMAPIAPITIAQINIELEGEGGKPPFKTLKSSFEDQQNKKLPSSVNAF